MDRGKSDSRCTTDVNCRTAEATEAVIKKRCSLTSSSVSSKIRKFNFECTYLFCEDLGICFSLACSRKSDRRKIEVSKIGCWRKLMTTIWMERVQN